MSGSEEHEATNTGAARSLDLLGGGSGNHNINFAENIVAHRALFRIDEGGAGRADIRTASVALLSRRELGVVFTLAALEVNDLDIFASSTSFSAWPRTVLLGMIFPSWNEGV